MSSDFDYSISFQSFYNVIDNQLTTTAKTRRGICPSTEEPLWDVPISTIEDTDKAVKAAKTANPGWRSLSYDERAAFLNKFTKALQANMETFTALLGRETGRPKQGASREMSLVMQYCMEAPTLRITEEKLIDDDDRTAIVRYTPLGVAVGIVPWNFPVVLGVGKMFPALLAGNTFIWKASPYTPYTALKMAELGIKVFPPGVFQALSGDNSLGPMLTAHPDVAMVSFTGSVATGKKVMAACAPTMKRVNLELGGNDAAIVCKDVDLANVIPKIGIFAFGNTGQTCMGIKRLYVHEDIYDHFIAGLVGFLSGLKTGGCDDSEAFFGPIQNKMQYSKLLELYSQIKAQGWKTAAGGAPADTSSTATGYFLQPTIIDNPPDDSVIVKEEQFGPIVPVLKWTDEDDAIRRANDSQMGLGASVWAKDVTIAKRMAEQLEAGSVWVNTHFELASHVPFGGHKQSGIGMEYGVVGLKSCLNAQACWIKHS